MSTAPSWQFDEMKQGAILVSCLVLVHHAVALVHDSAHNDLAVFLSMFQKFFVYIVITAFPVIGVVLLWTTYRKIGLYLIILGMGGGFVFGVYHHYMLESPDHISYLPKSSVHVQEKFIWTAGILAIFESVCAAVASYLLGKHTRAS